MSQELILFIDIIISILLMAGLSKLVNKELPVPEDEEIDFTTKEF